MEFVLTTTPVQDVHMSKPWKSSLDALNTADFLGRQDYIDWWIKDWLKKRKGQETHMLPLCISESLHCDNKMMRKYMKAITNSIICGDLIYLKSHYIIPDTLVWNFVDFKKISDEMFYFLACSTEIPKRLSPFIVASLRLNLLSAFVDKHDPTIPLRDAICHKWVGAVAWLLSEGAEITGDCVGMAVRHSRIFDLVTMYNPEAKQSDWEEFLLQCTLNRVPDVAQVEQWFFINGFKLDKSLLSDKRIIYA